MSNSLWTKPGATLSSNNACKEYGLTENEIIQAINDGKLQYRQNYIHGNPYFKLLRVEVQALALQVKGKQGVKKQEVQYKLQKISREINSLKRKLSSLEKEKNELLNSKL